MTLAEAELFSRSNGAETDKSLATFVGGKKLFFFAAATDMAGAPKPTKVWRLSSVVKRLFSRQPQLICAAAAY